MTVFYVHIMYIALKTKLFFHSENFKAKMHLIVIVTLTHEHIHTNAVLHYVLVHINFKMLK